MVRVSVNVPEAASDSLKPTLTMITLLLLSALVITPKLSATVLELISRKSSRNPEQTPRLRMFNPIGVTSAPATVPEIVKSNDDEAGTVNCNVNTVNCCLNTVNCGVNTVNVEVHC